ncbi:MAG: hypothetical protein WBN77_08240 [Desulfobacterales bacterium]
MVNSLGENIRGLKGNKPEDISIVMAVYNHENTVAEALESALMQEMPYRSVIYCLNDTFYFFVLIAIIMLNLLAMRIVLEGSHWDENIAQLLATIMYAATMYIFSRLLVFNVNAHTYFRYSR